MKRRLKTLWATSLHAAYFLIIFLMLIFMLLEIHNHRFWMNDFHVYYKAARRIWHSVSLYQPAADGHYRFKYAPVAAIYFLPFAWMPWFMAKIVYWVTLTLIIAGSLKLSFLLLPENLQPRTTTQMNNWIILTSLIMGVHWQRELHLGQVNAVLLASYLFLFWLAQSRRQAGAAVVWGAGLFLKPFGLIFLPYFLVKRQWRLVAIFFGVVAVLALSPLLFYDFTQMSHQYHSWLKEVGLELSHKQELLAAGNHTIFSVLARYTPFYWMAKGAASQKYFQALVLIALGGGFLWCILRGQTLPAPFAVELGLLTTLIPLLSFTSYNAFVYAAFAVLAGLAFYGKLDRVWKVVFFIGCLFLGGNIHDLWGHHLWTLWNNLSLVSIGAILICAVLIHVRFRNLG